MRFSVLILLFLLRAVQPGYGQSTALYDDARVSSVFLEMPPDSLAYMIINVVHDRYMSARFIFDDGVFRDTVQNVGVRLRGNTSLGAQKKSFKISFNAFQAGQEYQGVKKMNLRGQHNDPTMTREKLFYEVWQKAGMPERRAAFVKLYINQEYRGLYTNVEEMDKSWLGRVFPDNDGNLYKCTWPADLVYLGDDPATYKAIMNNPAERAYDLQTNETADDYTRLVLLIKTLNQPVDATFPSKISEILNVEAVLKAFAIDVATGNWDDYFYNKNNYYLYDNPATGRFEFVTYDTDNTFGVDWLGKDWATRNCMSWLPSGQPRPLATKLLAVPAFRDKYIHYLDSISRFITFPDTIFPRIDAIQAQISLPALADTYRTLDYGYTYSDFQNGFSQTIDFHTPYGIKPFLGIRYDSIRSQIQGLLTGVSYSLPDGWSVTCFPNPASDQLWVGLASGNANGSVTASVWDVNGKLWNTWQCDFDYVKLVSLSLTGLPAGAYVLCLQQGTQTGRTVFLKYDK